MASNKLSLSYRSVTYPHEDNVTRICCYGHLRCTLHSTSTPKVNKLTRMESFDDGFEEELERNSELQPKSTILRRNISDEGRLRTHQFHQTHSTSSGLTVPVQKILRFSDDSLSQSRREEHQEQSQGFRNHVRSISCLPLAKLRSPSPKNLSPSPDWKRSTFAKLNISPNRSQEKSDHSLCSCESLNKSSERRSHCERCSSQCSTEDSRDHSPVDPSLSNRSSGNDARSRRSQFRRAISLFSLSCDKETDRERRDKTPQRILRPPTRYVYRKGVSGLPIECTQRSMTAVY